MRNEVLQDAFVRAFNRVIDRKDEIIQICEDTIRERCDTSELVEQQAALRTDLEIVMELLQRQISANAHVAMDQAEYSEIMDLANGGALLTPCPPFHRGEEVTEDAIGSRYFAGYAFKEHLLEVQQAVLLFNLIHQ